MIMRHFLIESSSQVVTLKEKLNFKYLYEFHEVKGNEVEVIQHSKYLPALREFLRYNLLYSWSLIGPNRIWEFNSAFTVIYILDNYRFSEIISFSFTIKVFFSLSKNFEIYSYKLYATLKCMFLQYFF